MNILLFNKIPLRINAIVTVIALLVFALLIRLGFWQIARAEEKELRLQKIALYQQQDSMNLLKASKLFNDQKLINDLPVHLSGEFDNEKIFLLDNQFNKGRAGYQVLKIFKDHISGTKLLVNLGWIPGGLNRKKIPDIAKISGPVSFKGHIRIVEPGFTLGDQKLVSGQWPQRIEAVDIDKIETLLKEQLSQFLVYVDNRSALGYAKDWTPIVMPPAKHRAYAFQWFSLAAAWLVLMGAAAYKSAKSDQTN